MTSQRSAPSPAPEEGLGVDYGKPVAVAHPATGVPRGALAVVLAAAAAGVATIAPAGAALWVIMALSGLAATALAPGVGRHGLPVLAWLPAGFVAVTAAGTAAGLLALPYELLAQPGHLLPVIPFTLVLLALGAPSIVRRGRVHIFKGQWPAALAGTAVMAFAVGMWLFRPQEVWLRAVNNGTDFSRHLSFAKEIIVRGGLDYEASEYPRALHALMAVVWGPQGTPDFLSGWTGLEGVLWLTFALMAVAGSVIVTELGRRFRVPFLLSPVFAVPVFLLVLLQSMWVTAMFRLGFATSLVAGLVLMGVLAVGLERSFVSSRRALVVLTCGVVVMVHSWGLLAPSVALALALVWVSGLRAGQKRAFYIGVPLIGLIASLPAAWAMLGVDYQGAGLLGALGWPGESGLAFPRWYWWLLCGLAVVAVFGAKSPRWGWPGLWLALAIPAFLVEVALVVVNGETWPDLGYYTLKVLWIASALVLPVGVAGGGYLLHWAIARVSAVEGRRSRLAAQVGLLAAVTLVLAATSGWMAGTPKFWPTALREGGGYIPLQIPAVQALEDRGIEAQPGQGVVVWGLAPYANLDLIRTMGAYDWFSTEAMQYRGFMTDDSGVALEYARLRIADLLCEYLVEHPDVLKVTGPNPDAGLTWLEDAGCPAELTDPSSWVVVDIPDSWFVGLQPSNLEYEYPTWAEWQPLIPRSPGSTASDGG